MAELIKTQDTAPVQPVKAKKPRRSGRKKIIRRIITLVIVVALLAGVGMVLYRFLLGGSEQVGEIFSQPAYIGTIESRVSGSGVAKAGDSAAITLTQSGTVQEVFVTSGQQVMAGQPLYTIFSQAAQDQVSAAREKVEKLQQELAELEGLKGELTVRAPFAGKLIDVQRFSIGQQVPAGATVATLVNDRQLRLSLYFSYAYENDIYVGQSVRVSVPVVMNNFEGRVEQINRVSYISPEGAIHFEVVILFDNPGTLTEGMAAAALLSAEDGTQIYPYSDGMLEYSEVRTISAGTSGPVLRTGTLLNYANVDAGEALLYLDTSTLDSEIRAKQAEIDAAQLTLEEAESALADFDAVSPIDGTVISCTLTENAEVRGGDTVIIIANNTTMLVTINVDDRNISYVKPGSTVELTWNGMTYFGTVSSIDMGGAQSGSGMTNYPVTLTVENYDGSLMDGAWLQYSFVTNQSSDCVLVPSSSVQYFSDKDGNRQCVVFVRRDERPDDVPELELPTVEQGQKRRFPTEEEGFYPVIITTGISDAQSVEITSGVEPGDEVFVNYTVTDYGSTWG